MRREMLAAAGNSVQCHTLTSNPRSLATRACVRASIPSMGDNDAGGGDGSTPTAAAAPSSAAAAGAAAASTPTSASKRQRLGLEAQSTSKVAAPAAAATPDPTHARPSSSTTPAATGEMYERQIGYWGQLAPTVSSMLGGYEDVDPVDVEESRACLQRLVPSAAQRQHMSVIDCGAGIGRVTRHALLPCGFGRVDLLDACQAFLDKARGSISDARLGRLFCSPLAAFDWQAHQPWHLVWCQWSILYLADDELVAFLQRAAAALAPLPSSSSPDALSGPGFIVIKENVLRRGVKSPDFDEEDGSWVRSDTHLRRLFRRAKMEVLRTEAQPNWPQALYPVNTYILQAKAS